MKYATFISYNHRDRKAASWLHRALETYRIPKHMRGRDSAVGPLEARLPPIFQDREDLAASSDLAASVQEALADSASLIVICSPAGAQSRWVNEEIRTFARLGRRNRVQCLIVGGEPNASRLAGHDPTQECLPPALFEDGAGEPLAADIRPGQESRATARLKLLAGVLGVGFDELRQREQVRQKRRLVLLAAASTTGFAITSGLAILAMFARADAVEQRDVARQKTAVAERTVDFVRSMFEVADPSESRGRTITAREIIDLGAARIDRELAGQPSVKAALGTTLGETYTGLGLLGEGQALIRRMLALPNVDIGTRARQFVALGTTLEAKADDKNALKAYRRALALSRDPRSGRLDLVPRSLVGIGVAQTMLGDIDQGERNILAALNIDRARGPDGAVDVARGLGALGVNRVTANKLSLARADFEQALALRLARQGPLHPRTIQLMNQLGSTTYLQGDAAAAEAYFKRVLPLREKVLGGDHPEIATSLNNLARVLLERRKFRDAEPVLQRAVAIQLAKLGDTSADLSFILPNLALAQAGLGKDSLAEGNFERGLVVAEANKHRNRGPILTDLASLHCRRGDFAGAAAMLDRALPLVRADYPKDPWRTAWVENSRGNCLRLQGKLSEARDLLRSSTPTILARWPASSLYGAEAVRRARQAFVPFVTH